MPDVTEIIEELEQYGVPNERAHLLAAKLIIIGEKAAVYQLTETAVAQLITERKHRMS